MMLKESWCITNILIIIYKKKTVNINEHHLSSLRIFGESGTLDKEAKPLLSDKCKYFRGYALFKFNDRSGLRFPFFPAGPLLLPQIGYLLVG